MTTTPQSKAFLNPGPFFVIQNFLGAAFVERLLDFADAGQDRFVPSVVGSFPGRNDPDLRVSRLVRDLGD